MMIRPAIWLVLGAVLGVTGYRRLARLIRAMPGQGAAVALSGRQASGGAGRQLSRRQLAGSGLGRGSLALLRGVRVGMAEYRRGRHEYMNRQAGR
jgi:hypothetical protein